MMVEVVPVRLDTIVGYTFNADIYCPRCIVEVLPTGEGQAFDGWALADGVSVPTEVNLDEIAAAFGIDRYDERTFDSGDFPKVVFADAAEDGDRCGQCGLDLIEDF